MANRHQHFIDQLETQLDTIDDLNIIEEWSITKWNSYKFNYAFVDLGDEGLNLINEDTADDTVFQGIQIFYVWVGSRCSQNENIRNKTNELTYNIENIFQNWKIDDADEDNYEMYIYNTRVTKINPARIDEDKKGLYLIVGEINYQYEWKN